YRTIYGAIVNLIPVPGPISKDDSAARLVFHLGPLTANNTHSFHVAPEGDFILSVDGAMAGESHGLLCGLEGTEYITFIPQLTGAAECEGDRLRFVSRCGAFGLSAPCTEGASTVEPQEGLLDSLYLTSWAKLVPAPEADDGAPDGAPRRRGSEGRRAAITH